MTLKIQSDMAAMSNTLRRLNWILFSLICASSLWAWVNLPELETYPIHWNARGEADGFSSKSGVALVLSLMPITALFTHALMLGLTKIDAIKTSIKQSSPVYDIVWNGCLWLYLGINVVLCMVYSGMVKGEPATLNSAFFLRFIPVAMGLFFIIIGNVMGKARQNKFVGVKTPWTFKSKSTWDATHRLSGWLWVAGGLAMMILPFVTSLELSVVLMVALILIMSFVPIIYSYLYYRTAKDKID